MKKKVESGMFYLLIQDLTRWLVRTIRLVFTQRDIMETQTFCLQAGVQDARVSFTPKRLRAVRPPKAEPGFHHPTDA